MPKIVIIALIILGLMQPAAAALPSCTSASEQNAMTVRAFQSFLMLAGVACNQAQAYNRFMTRYNGQISGHGDALKGYFQRVYAAKAEAKMNDFVTELANAWSAIHLRDMKGYCKASWDIMMLLERLPRVDDSKLVQASRAMAGQKPVPDVLCAPAQK
jgi:hypothetical protein